ncbi:MAG: helix-turn-helix domain-containing protein, partial [bacterium]|nr:helix-turn-helix domain-containing protein [bacterium]
MTHKSVEKAISVLNCFSPEAQILGVGEISHLTGYTK